MRRPTERLAHPATQAHLNAIQAMTNRDLLCQAEDEGWWDEWTLRVGNHQDCPLNQCYDWLEKAEYGHNPNLPDHARTVLVDMALAHTIEGILATGEPEWQEWLAERQS